MKIYISIFLIIILIIIYFYPVNKEQFTENITSQNLALRNLDNIVNNIVKHDKIEIPYDVKGTNLNYSSINFSNNFVPYGTIIAFHGENIPDGWVLCNGQNNTPDLRNKFIYGQDKERTSSNNLQSGEANVTLTEDTIPAHKHFLRNVYKKKNSNISSEDSEQRTNFRGHNTTNNTGGGNSHNNLHPYTKIRFIMKI